MRCTSTVYLKTFRPQASIIGYNQYPLSRTLNLPYVTISHTCRAGAGGWSASGQLGQAALRTEACEAGRPGALAGAADALEGLYQGGAGKGAGDGGTLCLPYLQASKNVLCREKLFEANHELARYDQSQVQAKHYLLPVLTGAAVVGCEAFI